jgi:hypothetical protein
MEAMGGRMSGELQSAVMKLFGYANGSIHPGYIHFNRPEAQAVLDALLHLEGEGDD